MEVVEEFGAANYTLGETGVYGRLVDSDNWIYGIRHDRCCEWITTSMSIPLDELCKCVPNVVTTLVMIAKRTA